MRKLNKEYDNLRQYAFKNPPTKKLDDHCRNMFMSGAAAACDILFEAKLSPAVIDRVLSEIKEHFDHLEAECDLDDAMNDLNG